MNVQKYERHEVSKNEHIYYFFKVASCFADVIRM